MIYNHIKSTLLLVILIIALPCIGQNTYNLSGGVDAPLLYGGAIGLGISIPINKKIDPLTPEQIEALDPYNINPLERVATKSFSHKSRKISDYFLRLSPVLPLGLLADSGSRNEFGTVSIMYLETSMVTFGINELSKVLARRTRPFVYNRSVGNKEKMKRDARKSFFSGHTSHVAATSFFTAKVWTDMNPDGKYNSVYWATAATIPVITAYLRVKGGKHFPTDVLVGYLVGAAVGILVPELHK